jgi:hypothetical protein
MPRRKKRSPKADLNLANAQASLVCSAIRKRSKRRRKRSRKRRRQRKKPRSIMKKKLPKRRRSMKRRLPRKRRSTRRSSQRKSRNLRRKRSRPKPKRLISHPTLPKLVPQLLLLLLVGAHSTIRGNQY